jgi:hypothetical protein
LTEYDHVVQALPASPTNYGTHVPVEKSSTASKASSPERILLHLESVYLVLCARPERAKGIGQAHSGGLVEQSYEEDRNG